jgi:hypothetical protein
LNGANVLKVMGLMLLILGAAGVVVLAFGEARPVMWLGAIGPCIMGVALLIIARALAREQ